MATSQPIAEPRPRPVSGTLLGAAASLVAQDGFAGLTLRPLAAALGVSVSSLTSRHGSREDIVAQVLADAAAEDRRVLETWVPLRDLLSPGHGVSHADFAELVLDQTSDNRRELLVLFLECVQASGWDEEVRTALAEWRGVRAEFWNRLARRAGVPEAVIDSGLIEGYFIDELAYSACLGGLPAYRVLRRLCLRRLFTNLMPDPAADPGPAGDAQLGEALHGLLGEDASAPNVLHGAALPRDWRLAAAKCCAVLLTRQGVSALTHRRVAAEAGLKPTTLAYRFPTQEDLVIAGLEYIITHLLTDVGETEPSGSGQLVAPDPMEGLDVGRATFSVALAAIRIPRLVPCAADMRRNRGINLVRLLKSRSPDYARMDCLSAQTLAVGIVGATLFVPVQEASVERTESLVEPARRWMIGASPPS